MQIKFHKYQATGNDFIIIDNRDSLFPKNNSGIIQKLCDRKFGVGADGLILLELATDANFNMIYYNADGGLGSFCGNGSRAVVSFARSLALIDGRGSFEAYDGLHEARIVDNLVQIKMGDVQNGRQLLNGTFIDTGSPHYVEFVENIDKKDVTIDGRKLRYSSKFEPNGANINFVQIVGANELNVRTYERGVENETLSCGTGVTASAIAAVKSGMGTDIIIHTSGGKLRVWFEISDNGYRNIWLEGPAEEVFSGEIDI